MWTLCCANWNSSTKKLVWRKTSVKRCSSMLSCACLCSSIRTIAFSCLSHSLLIFWQQAVMILDSWKDPVGWCKQLVTSNTHLHPAWAEKRLTVVLFLLLHLGLPHRSLPMARYHMCPQLEVIDPSFPEPGQRCLIPSCPGQSSPVSKHIWATQVLHTALWLTEEMSSKWRQVWTNDFWNC